MGLETRGDYLENAVGPRPLFVKGPYKRKGEGQRQRETGDDVRLTVRMEGRAGHEPGMRCL